VEHYKHEHELDEEAGNEGTREQGNEKAGTKN